jgi:hypothetical protein
LKLVNIDKTESEVKVSADWKVRILSYGFETERVSLGASGSLFLHLILLILLTLLVLLDDRYLGVA